MRQNAGVQHVWVGDDQPRPASDCGAVSRRCVAIIHTIGSVRQLGIGQPKRTQAGELVLGQGFGWEDVQGTRFRLGEKSVEDGQVVAQGFTAGCAGYNDNMPAGLNQVPRQTLVCVQRMNATLHQRRGETRMHPSWKRRISGFPERQIFPGNDISADTRFCTPVIEKFIQRHRPGTPAIHLPG